MTKHDPKTKHRPSLKDQPRSALCASLVAGEEAFVSSGLQISILGKKEIPNFWGYYRTWFDPLTILAKNIQTITNLL